MNKYFGILEGLEKVELNLTDLGLIPADGRSDDKSELDKSSDSSFCSLGKNELSQIAEEDKGDAKKAAKVDSPAKSSIQPSKTSASPTVISLNSPVSPLKSKQTSILSKLKKSPTMAKKPALLSKKTTVSPKGSKQASFAPQV